jgi:hypothetical protein
MIGSQTPDAAPFAADPPIGERVVTRAAAAARHASFKITTEIYTQVTDQQTRDALKRLGESLG